MKALLLNSGLGTRMGAATQLLPKCLVEIYAGETILSRQLKLLCQAGIGEIIITTGFAGDTLVDYCHSLNLPCSFTFVENPLYKETNYIYSIYLARGYLKGDMLLLHGDLVFEQSILEDIRGQSNSAMAISSEIPLPEKDFKAVLKDGMIEKVGIDYFCQAYTAQPIYKLNAQDWQVWLQAIEDFIAKGKLKCYAEDALNQVTDRCRIYPLDFGNRFCAEVDTPADLARVKEWQVRLYERKDGNE